MNRFVNRFVDRFGSGAVLALFAVPVAGQAPPRVREPAELPVCTGFQVPAPDAATIEAAVALLPESFRAEATRALSEAGGNGMELVTAIRNAPPAQREGLAFLLANMPARDLESLGAGFLLENVALAYAVRAETPWGRTLPEAVFLNDVLPYASLNERRDDWRRDFMDRFLATARDAGSIEGAVMKLNRAVFRELNVSYHATKRPKPDQSPYESIEAGYASCTGLSILLVDALRAVGVPARVAGTPQWSDGSGNHTWVEVWDDGTWHHVGAAEPGPYDRTWFNGRAAEADPDVAEHRIYAASFARTPVSFPLVWAEDVEYVHAVDVTADYIRGSASPAPQ